MAKKKATKKKSIRRKPAEEWSIGQPLAFPQKKKAGSKPVANRGSSASKTLVPAVLQPDGKTSR
jgi:hypothetical protein